MNRFVRLLVCPIGNLTDTYIILLDCAQIDHDGFIHEAICLTEACLELVTT